MRKIVILLPLFIFILFFTHSINAQINSLSPLKKISESKSIATQSGKSASAAVVKNLARTDNLAEFKIKACEARQANIKRRSEKMIERAEKMQSLFAQMTVRVEEFYQAKALPQGKTVPNYDALISDIAVKNASVTDLFQAVRDDAANFSCDKDRPAEQVLQFNKDMKALIVGLNAYKLSVKNLLVAVKTALGQNSTNATSSASPF